MVLDWETKAVGTELELGAEVLRIRLIDAEPHIDNAGQFTPQVAMAEGRPAVATINRIGVFVQLMFSEFARDFR